MSHILNQAQLDQMADKRETGWSYARIAKWFEAQGVHVASQTIAWQCVRLGIIGPRTVAQAGGRTVSRGRAFTPDEDRRLLEMSLAGARRIDMERALGRSRSSLIARLYILPRSPALKKAPSHQKPPSRANPGERT